MKYAVIALSGTQFKIEENKTITVDKIDAKEGDILSSDQILLYVDDQKIDIGSPTVKDITCTYKILKHYQGPKIRVFKYKAKSRYRKTIGFRAQLTDIQIIKIGSKSETPSPVKEAKKTTVAKKPVKKSNTL